VLEDAVTVNGVDERPGIFMGLRRLTATIPRQRGYFSGNGKAAVR
jgi:hypothetical protein